jgi:DNA-nicking Smr family endonuclease
MTGPKRQRAPHTSHRPADENAAKAGEPADAPEPEQDLFREAMGDVQPIEKDRHVPEVSFRTPVPISEREREVLRELDRILSGERPLELWDTGELREGSVKGLDPRIMKRLRRGEFTVQADLDLHGIDAATARGLLERFIADCHAEGLRCLRVVHGRGRNSPGGVPVLKDNLPRWLARGPARLIVLAYASATPRDGGSGASYILLRKQRAHGGRRGSRP